MRSRQQPRQDQCTEFKHRYLAFSPSPSSVASDHVSQSKNLSAPRSTVAKPAVLFVLSALAACRYGKLAKCAKGRILLMYFEAANSSAPLSIQSLLTEIGTSSKRCSASTTASLLFTVNKNHLEQRQVVCQQQGALRGLVGTAAVSHFQPADVNH